MPRELRGHACSLNTVEVGFLCAMCVDFGLKGSAAVEHHDQYTHCSIATLPFNPKPSDTHLISEKDRASCDKGPNGRTMEEDLPCMPLVATCQRRLWLNPRRRILQFMSIQMEAEADKQGSCDTKSAVTLANQNSWKEYTTP